MAKVVENKKGFKVINMDNTEAKSLGFGIYNTGVCICMHCNCDIPHKDILYVSVLNDTLCRDCYEKWVKHAKFYKEDAPYELRNFENVKNKLGI
jgi:hypothetical protein